MSTQVTGIDAGIIFQSPLSEGGQTSKPLEVAKFEQLLSSMQTEHVDISLVNKPEEAGIGSMMKAAVDGMSGINRNFKGMLEESLKTLSKVDPTDPRAMVAVLETTIQMSVVEVQMQFAIKSAGSTKESLNTLLRTQG
jgi:hypothetical protein